MAVLQNIMNPPGANMPERLSDLKTARTNRRAAEATTEAQELKSALARVDMIGRSAQSMLSSYYPEGSEQPTNPTQAAREYFQTRKRLIDMGVPKNALPEKVPTRSQLEQARDQALTVQQQIEAQQQPSEQFTLSPGEVRYQSGPEGTQPIATGLPEERGGVEPEATDTYLNKNTQQEETLVRTNRGLARQTVNDQGEVVYEPVNSANYTKIDRRRVTTETIGGQERAGGDLTMGDIITGDPGNFPTPDPQLAAGPRDRLVSVATRVPVVNETMQFLTGNPRAGEEERIANRLGDEIENQTIMAFKPSDDDRTSNLQIELARKLSPRMGAFATDESVMTDLRTLHERTMEKIRKKLAVANNEKFTDNTRRDAEQRAIQLGNLVALTGPLIQAAEDPKYPVEVRLGTTIDDADPIEVRRVLSQMPSTQRTRFFKALSDEQRSRLNEAWSQ